MEFGDNHDVSMFDAEPPPVPTRGGRRLPRWRIWLGDVAGWVLVLGVLGLILFIPCLCALGMVVYSADVQNDFPVVGAVTGVAMGLVLLAVVVFFGIGLIHSYVRMWRLRIRGITTSATVVRSYVQEGHSEDGGDTFHAVVRIDGTNVTTDIITTGRRRATSEPLRVRYDPKDPPNSLEVQRTIGSFIGWILVEAVMLTLVVGLLGLFVGLGVALYQTIR